MARIGVCKKSRASIRALGRQLHQQENLFPCLFRREYQLFWGDLGELYSITYCCCCCCWKNEGRRPNPPYKEDIGFVMVEHHSEDTRTSPARCIQHTALAVGTLPCPLSLPDASNMQTCLHQLKVYEEECGILISDGNILK